MDKRRWLPRSGGAAVDPGQLSCCRSRVGKTGLLPTGIGGAARRFPAGRARHSLYYTAYTRANHGGRAGMPAGWYVAVRGHGRASPCCRQIPHRVAGMFALYRAFLTGVRKGRTWCTIRTVSSAPLPTKDSRHACSSIRRPLAWGWRFAPGPDRIYNLGRLWLQFKGTGWSKSGQGEIEILGRRPLAARLYHGSAVRTRIALPTRTAS